LKAIFMTRIWLIRHGSHDWLGKELVGRRTGIHLNAQGHAEAERVANAVMEECPDAIYSSPMERALETAEPLARACGLEVIVEPEFNEIDFGEWTGRTFAELDSDARWRLWNSQRSRARVPGGETMQDVQERTVNACAHIARTYRGGKVAVFSHGDLIRSILAHASGISLDLLQTIEFTPGAIASIDWAADGPRVWRTLTNAECYPLCL